MSKLNQKSVNTRRTHEGAVATPINAELELRRTLMTCMLWEDNFYENGVSVADRIAQLIPKTRPEFAAACAYEARTKMKLRHAPLLVVREMARHDGHKALVGRLLPDVIQRADELNEFMAIYWKDGKTPISAQVKKGLAAAYQKFGGHALAKYDQDKAIKLRDVLFMVHAKPSDAPGDKFTKEQRQAIAKGEAAPRPLTKGEKLYADLIAGQLDTPDTWETNLSAGADKKETFERLMAEGNLGALAFIRNLRNMAQSGVSKDMIRQYAAQVKTEKVLPFRFLAAARMVPQYEDVIEPMMLKCMEGQPKFAGKTKILIDVSGSMDAALSGKSDMKRVDAAYGVAILAREVCEDVEIYTFSNSVVQVPPRRGFALRDAMHNSQTHGGTYMGAAVQMMNQTPYDRLIVITDEQSADRVPNPKSDKAYIINVAPYKNGVAYDTFTHINGWSDAVIDFIRVLETDFAEV